VNGKGDNQRPRDNTQCTQKQFNEKWNMTFNTEETRQRASDSKRLLEAAQVLIAHASKYILPTENWREAIQKWIDDYTKWNEPLRGTVLASTVHLESKLKEDEED